MAKEKFLKEKGPICEGGVCKFDLKTEPKKPKDSSKVKK